MWIAATMITGNQSCLHHRRYFNLALNRVIPSVFHGNRFRISVSRRRDVANPKTYPKQAHPALIPHDTGFHGFSTLLSGIIQTIFKFLGRRGSCFHSRARLFRMLSTVSSYRLHCVLLPPTQGFAKLPIPKRNK